MEFGWWMVTDIILFGTIIIFGVLGIFLIAYIPKFYLQRKQLIDAIKESNKAKKKVDPDLELLKHLKKMLDFYDD